MIAQMVIPWKAMSSPEEPIIAAAGCLSNATTEAADARQRCLVPPFTNMTAFGTVKAPL
jgi:hypothetical protein